jgi:hypothetical protein
MTHLKRLATEKLQGLRRNPKPDSGSANAAGDDAVNKAA